MQLIRPASVDEIVQAFRCDSKVLALHCPWPAKPSERVFVLRRSERPIDLFLSLAWGLFSLDREEFLNNVYTVVWFDAAYPDGLSLKETAAQLATGYDPHHHLPKIRQLEASMREGFRAEAFTTFVGYLRSADRIDLEEGHHRAIAAMFAGCVPETVRVFLGRPPELTA
jgi:hypothetical protein